MGGGACAEEGSGDAEEEKPRKSNRFQCADGFTRTEHERMKRTEHRFVWMLSLKRGSLKKTVFISNVKVGHQSDPEVGSNEVEFPGIST